MKFSIKTLLLVISILALILFASPPAWAEEATQDLLITNSIPANATTTINLGGVLKIDNQDFCSVVFSGTGSASGSLGVQINFARSVDNVVWETTPLLSVAFLANGTTAFVGFTNLNKDLIGGAAYLKVVSIVNSNTTSVIGTASLVIGKKRIHIASLNPPAKFGQMAKLTKVPAGHAWSDSAPAGKGSAGVCTLLVAFMDRTQSMRRLNQLAWWPKQLV